MSWIKEDYQYSYIQRLCMYMIKNARIPRHVAIIMDGNRRYAAKTHIRKIEGHSIGFDKLSETLQWCRDLNIKEVSVYAFSLHNFNRETEEVNYLMDLARNKFNLLYQEKKLLEKYQVQVKIIGNLSLLPNDLQEILKEVINITKNYNRFFLNICMAYTSHDEIIHSMKCISRGIKAGQIFESDIDEHLVEKCMYLKGTTVDLLIRTSGESRLSDFLMWQSRNAYVMFIDKYWPEFSCWTLMMAIMYYNKYYFNTKIIGQSINNSIEDTYNNNNHTQDHSNTSKKSRVTKFLISVENSFTDWLSGRSSDYFD